MNRKKAATLAELCIVMAVTAAVCAMIVSFSLLISAHVGRITEAQNIQSDLGLISDANARWLGRFDSEEYSLKANPDGSLSALSGASEYRIRLEEGVYYADMPDGRRLEYPVPAVRSVSFSLKKGGNGRFMTVCSVTYLKIASATGVRLEHGVKMYRYIYAAKEAAD